MLATGGMSSPSSSGTTSPVATPLSPTSAHHNVSKGIWSQEEHDRFLHAMKLYPKGPWKAIADHIATRSVRQVQTHAQKYQEKVSRRLRGLRKSKKKLVRPEHRIDEDTMELCKLVDSAAEKLVLASRAAPGSAVAAGIKLEPIKKKVRTTTPTATVAATALSPILADMKTNVLDLDFDVKKEQTEPLPLLDFNEDIELDPVLLPTVSESLDFLIEYLSI